MKASNQIVQETTSGARKPKGPTFSEKIGAPAYQKMIATAIQDVNLRNRFITGIIAAVAANPQLQTCDAVSVVSAGLQGAALGLSPSPALGEFYIVPYGTSAQFQIGVGGLLQLALRSGQYKDIFAIEVREGEYLGRDPYTGREQFRFISDDEVREELPIIGYLATYTLLNGARDQVYYSETKVLKWADRYSKAFSLKKYEAYISGKLSPDEHAKLESQHWYGNHTAMGLKTVLRRLLRNAPKSIEMATAMINDVDATMGTQLAHENMVESFFSDTESESPAENTMEKKNEQADADKSQKTTKSTDKKSTSLAQAAMFDDETGDNE